MSIPREGSRDTGEGIIISKYPDVCKAPVSPVPFCSIGIQADDANTCATVRQTRLRSHNMGSLVTCCSGDEPGVGLGIKSGMVGSICEPKGHSATVRFEGKHAVRDGDLWHINNRNTEGPLIYVKDKYTYSTIFDDKEKERKERPDREPHDKPAALKSGSNRTDANRVVMTDADPMPWVAGEQYAFVDETGRFSNPTTTTITTPSTSTTPRVRPQIRIPGGMGSSGGAAAVFLGAIRTEMVQRNINEAEEIIPLLNNGYGFKIDPTNDYQVNAVVRFVEDIHARKEIMPGVGGASIYTEAQALDRLRERLDKEEQITRTETPAVTVTDENVRTTEEERQKKCRVLPYRQLRGTCGPNEQAHHIVPNYTLHYGNRPQAMEGLKQIGDGGGGTWVRNLNFPGFWEGPAICLTGNSGTAATEHWEAHLADSRIAAMGQHSGASYPAGTAPIGPIIDAAEQATIAAKPECRAEIQAAVTSAFAGVPPTALGRTTKTLPTGDAFIALYSGTSVP